MSGGPGMARVALVLVLGALVAGGVVLQQSTSDETPSSPGVPAVAAREPVVPPGDASSVVWFCAEGTAGPDGRADETILVGNLSRARIDAEVTVLPGGDGRPATRRLSVEPLGRARVRVADVLETAEPGVVVEVFGGPAVVEHELRGAGDVAIGACARRASPDWYFAAGTTAVGTEQHLALFNPYSDDAIVDVSFLTETGVNAPEPYQALVVPRRSRITLAVHEQVRRRAQAAAEVHARTGRIVAERSLRSDGSAAPAGLAVSLGTPAPARRWVLPVAGPGDGSEASVAVANFGPLPTEVQLGFLLASEEVLEPETITVPARSVETVDLGERLAADTPSSVTVRATQPGPVVAELALASAADAPVPGLATTLGSTVEARRWAFAESRPRDGDAVIVATNRTRRPLTVELLAFVGGDPNSPRSAPARAVAPGRRAVFVLSEVGVEPGQVIVVQADGPITVARLVDGGGLSVAGGIPELR